MWLTQGQNVTTFQFETHAHLSHLEIEMQVQNTTTTKKKPLELSKHLKKIHKVCD